ncbi:hypothetical protein JWG42_01665 [Desulfoprunum benzoelyticum]|uniref:Uncharacterized protein n=1 Tax=Desulfoprunum benzoelyticum TaxID=1506996 RepID=A0A840V502_9BACT|nr:hypothetical protein [Desulfoprunum benzoelyticum]MBB5348980.1 hypothetical protein [Desulfoprunum benzoelyticum]MBM9528858.1 hypothetical protein [Desulfoprunum benzoelyticum]
MPTRESCRNQLYFLVSEPDVHVCSWKKRAEKAVRLIQKTIEEDEEGYENDSLGLKPAYHFFAAMAILVSVEFDACIEALISDNWTAFEKLYSIEKLYCFEHDINWKEYRMNILFDIAITLRLNWNAAWNTRGEMPVRELTSREKLTYLQEIGRLHRTPESIPEWKNDGFSYEHRPPLISNRIHISIDPLTPVEIVTKMVSKILEEKHSAYFEEIEQSWKNEIENGAHDETFVSNEIMHAKASFDFRRTMEKNKRTRGGLTTFEIMLRSLLAFEMDRKGKTKSEIAQKKWWGKIDMTSSTLSKDLNQAKKLIKAALSGIPLSAVKRSV